jgi:hypothetical protein
MLAGEVGGYVKIERVMMVGLALLVGILMVRPVIEPEVVRAQEIPKACGLQFEPLTTTIRAPGADRQVIGKIAYDTCNGKIWGFPTLSSAPYPVDSTNPNPPTSHPIYLGRFAVEETQK